MTHVRTYVEWFLYSLRQHAVLYGSQRVVDLDEVLLAVLLQHEGVKVQFDPVTRLRPQLPLQVRVGRIRGVRKARRPERSALTGVDRKRLPG